MTDQGRKRKLLWAAVLGGGLLLAVFFISAAAPRPGPAATEPVIRPNSDLSLAVSAGSATPIATPAASTSLTGSSGSAFSLGGGELFDLAWRIGLVIVVIAGSIVGLRWWTKRTAGPRSATGFLRVVDTLAIGSGRSIHLVSIGDRVIAIGATAQQLSFLNELSEDEAASIRATTAHASEQPLAGFAAELFHQLRRPPQRGGPTDRLSRVTPTAEGTEVQL